MHKNVLAIIHFDIKIISWWKFVINHFLKKIPFCGHVLCLNRFLSLTVVNMRSVTQLSASTGQNKGSYTKSAGSWKVSFQITVVLSIQSGACILNVTMLVIILKSVSLLQILYNTYLHNLLTAVNISLQCKGQVLSYCALWHGSAALKDCAVQLVVHAVLQPSPGTPEAAGLLTYIGR
jgi:hypothetical protein